MFQQLLHNAVRYSPHGGAIDLRLMPHGATVQVTVADHGIGIPPVAVPHVFERYYRAANVDPWRISGFGIGLYVVREIVRHHGGTIAVQSCEGHGSTFTVRLPHSASQEQARAVGDAASPCRSG